MVNITDIIFDKMESAIRFNVYDSKLFVVDEHLVFRIRNSILSPVRSLTMQLRSPMYK